jgi:hypothetical protein
MADTDRSIPFDAPVKRPLLGKWGVLKVLVPAGLITVTVLIALLLLKKYQPTSKISEDRLAVSVESDISEKVQVSKVQSEGLLRDRATKPSDVRSELSERFEDLNTRVKLILADLNELKTAQLAYFDKVDGIDSRLSSIEHAEQGKLMAQDELSLRLGAIEEKLDNFSKVQDKVRKPPLPVKRAVDFKLLSIDQWGGVYNAVIDHKGLIVTVSEGDTIEQWRVQSIGHEGCLEVRSLTDQSRKTVCQVSRSGDKL